jgi:hypothetical protein
MKLLALKSCLPDPRRLFHFSKSLICDHAAKKTGDAENQPKHRLHAELKSSAHRRIIAGWRFKLN